MLPFRGLNKYEAVETYRRHLPPLAAERLFILCDIPSRGFHSEEDRSTMGGGTTALVKGLGNG